MRRSIPMASRQGSTDAINRRDVIGGALAAAGAALTGAAREAAAAPGDDSQNERFWFDVAMQYDLDGRYTVLNGGGNNPLPRPVVEALTRYQRRAASQPRPFNYQFIAYREQHRESLASLFDCKANELALTRNTTEGLNIVARGLALARGDQVLVSNYDERYALAVFAPLAERYGIDVEVVNLPVSPSANDVVEAFASKMTRRTKLLAVSHVVDSWGFVLPIPELSQLAHSRDARLLVDGALSFGHIPVSMRDMGCDYYATSLHKWLNAPLGTGALFVREDRVADLWPLYGVSYDAGDIRKFESIGTRDGAAIAAIGQAIDFYDLLGPQRKAARLKYLLDLAVRQLEVVDGITVFSEPDRQKRVGLARIVVAGWTGRALTDALRDDFGFWIYGNFPGEHDGVYLSPNVFNSPSDIHRFVQAMRTLAAV